jgi:peptidoglycan/xylan/chitin deacetylase (PgdA/CDA1 family)
VQTPEFVAVVVQPGETLAALAGTWLLDPSRAWEIAEYNGITVAAPGQELVIPLRPFRRGGLAPERYQTVPVLAYHQFAEKSTNSMTVSREAFEAQMQLLKVKGYRVITLQQLVDFVDFRGQVPEKSVVITIDDGWRATYDIAFPILRKYGYPATLFIYTQLITGGGKTLSWDQVREMAAQGLDVQCHTISHRNLALPQAQESADQYLATITREITESARTIEQKLGKRPTMLAYPYGDTNGLAITLLKRQGYRAALTVTREANPFFTAPFRLGRAMIYGDFDLARFEKNLVTADRRALR